MHIEIKETLEDRVFYITVDYLPFVPARIAMDPLDSYPAEGPDFELVEMREITREVEIRIDSNEAERLFEKHQDYLFKTVEEHIRQKNEEKKVDSQGWTW